jgi:hypothetical protein
MHRVLLAITIAACGSPALPASTDAMPPPPPPVGGGPTFFPPDVYPVGAVAVGVAAGDLDGDGRIDLAVVHTCDANAVGVLRGNGDGTFGGETFFPTTNCPMSVAIVDMNRDGRADIVVASADDLDVLLNQDDGSFASLDTPGARWGWRLAVGDFNDDGVPDAVTSGLETTVFLGNGDGSMTPPFSPPHVSYPIDVATSDVNNDGNEDIIVLSNGPWVGPSTVAVFLGHGDGTFGAPITAEVGNLPQALAVGDFDGDRHPDLVVANSGGDSTAQTVSVVFGNGDGTFAPQQVIALVTDTLTAGDVDGDGLDDIVLSRGRILRSTGNRAFAPVEDDTCGGCGRPVLADVDGDGLPDLIGASVQVVGYGIDGGSTVSVMTHRH